VLRLRAVLVVKGPLSCIDHISVVQVVTPVLAAELETVTAVQPGEIILNNGAAIRGIATRTRAVTSQPASQGGVSSLKEDQRKGGATHSLQAKLSSPVSFLKNSRRIAVAKPVVSQSKMIQLV
jgi:hypothetical protein